MEGLALSQFRGPNIFLGESEKVPLLAARITRIAEGLHVAREISIANETLVPI